MLQGIGCRSRSWTNVVHDNSELVSGIPNDTKFKDPLALKAITLYALNVNLTQKARKRTKQFFP